MNGPHVNYKRRPQLTGTRMILAFSGWMDGGDVSTGTVERLIQAIDAEPFAEISPEPFYIYNFPGGMELAALFRPHIRIENGRVETFEPPSNVFYVDESRNLVLFVGKEPHMQWSTFAETIFDVVREMNVDSIVFVGSFGGAVPHTREPRLYASASKPDLLEPIRKFGVRPTDYEGPGSFATYLVTQAEAKALDMVSLVAEIPGYLQGTNPTSIAAVTRQLARLLDLSVDLEELREASTEWELRVSDEVEKNDELAEQVRELEQAYDDDLIEHKADDGGTPQQH